MVGSPGLVCGCVGLASFYFHELFEFDPGRVNDLGNCVGSTKSELELRTKLVPLFVCEVLECSS